HWVGGRRLQKAGQVVELVGRGGLVEDAYSKGAAVVLESVEGALWGRVEAEVFVSCGDGNRVRAGMVGDVRAESLDGPVALAHSEAKSCGVGGLGHGEGEVNDGSGAGVDHAEAAVLKADPANLEGVCPVSQSDSSDLRAGSGSDGQSTVGGVSLLERFGQAPGRPSPAVRRPRRPALCVVGRSGSSDSVLSSVLRRLRRATRPGSPGRGPW
ncbi:hypothetical protein THAOC_22105, partial [Thalassiosira oceanica]